MCGGGGRNTEWLSELTLTRKCVSELPVSGRDNRGALAHHCLQGTQQEGGLRVWVMGRGGEGVPS